MSDDLDDAAILNRAFSISSEVGSLFRRASETPSLLVRLDELLIGAMNRGLTDFSEKDQTVILKVVVCSLMSDFGMQRVSMKDGGVAASVAKIDLGDVFEELDVKKNKS